MVVCDDSDLEILIPEASHRAILLRAIEDYQIQFPKSFGDKKIERIRGLVEEWKRENEEKEEREENQMDGQEEREGESEGEDQGERGSEGEEDGEEGEEREELFGSL